MYKNFLSPSLIACCTNRNSFMTQTPRLHSKCENNLTAHYILKVYAIYVIMVTYGTNLERKHK